MPEAGFQVPYIEEEFETVRTILREGSSIARYGDGEIRLCNKGAVYFQEKDPRLKKMLNAVLHSDNPKLLVCIPRIFHRYDWPYTEHQQAFWEHYGGPLLTNLLKPGKNYYSMAVTRSDLARHIKCEMYHDLVKKIWEGKTVILVQGDVSNKRIPEPEKNSVFDNIEKLIVEDGTAKNGFRDYDETLAKVMKHSVKNTVVYLALGPSATVMAAELCANGYQALDMGHYYQNYGGRMKRRPLEQRPQLTDKIENPPTEKRGGTCEEGMHWAGLKYGAATDGRLQMSKSFWKKGKVRADEKFAFCPDCGAKIG